ncbi:MAG: hypothetical protein ACRDWD_02720 [Acidimicrobiia bacterium]
MSILEFRDDLVVRETNDAVERWEAPDWRAPGREAAAASLQA